MKKYSFPVIYALIATMICLSFIYAVMFVNEGITERMDKEKCPYVGEEDGFYVYKCEGGIRKYDIDSFKI